MTGKKKRAEEPGGKKKGGLATKAEGGMTGKRKKCFSKKSSGPSKHGKNLANSTFQGRKKDDERFLASGRGGGGGRRQGGKRAKKKALLGTR